MYVDLAFIIFCIISMLSDTKADCQQPSRPYMMKEWYEMFNFIVE